MDGSTSRFIKEKEIKKILGVSGWSLRHWADSGKINSIRTPGGHRLYELKDLERPNVKEVTDVPKKGIFCATTFRRPASRGTCMPSSKKMRSSDR